MRHPAQRAGAGRSTKADRDQLRERMRSYGCSVEQVAAEMARRHAARPRLAWRYALGWPQWKLAMEYNAATGRTGMTDARISEYEAWPFGGARPSVQVLAGLAAAFGHGCTPGRLVDADDLDRMDQADRLLLAGEPRSAEDVIRAGQQPGPPGQRPGQHGRCDHRAGPSSSEPAAPVVVVVGGPDEELRARARRRDALVHPVGPGDGPTSEKEFAMSAADQSAEFAAWAEASNVGNLTLDQLHAGTRQLARAQGTGPFVLARQALLLRNRSFGLLEGHQYPHQTRELYAVAGWSCALLAWFSNDLGHGDAAETHARTAWLCAELADHNDLRAWACATRATIGFWRGEVLAAARTAEEGLAHARAGTSGVMLAVMAAANWARCGNAEQARMLLARATEERERVTGSDHLGGLFGCDPAREYAFTASAFLRLDQPDRALVEIGRALELPDLRYGTEALARLDAAVAYLALGDLDGAEHMLEPVLELVPDKRVHSMVLRLGGVFDLLGRPRYRDSAGARALQERIADFRAESLPRTLPT